MAKRTAFLFHMRRTRGEGKFSGRCGLLGKNGRSPEAVLFNGGSCIRLRPERRNHRWSYDFVEAQTHDGQVRRLTLIDEFTCE